MECWSASQWLGEAWICQNGSPNHHTGGQGQGHTPQAHVVHHTVPGPKMSVVLGADLEGFIKFF